MRRDPAWGDGVRRDVAYAVRSLAKSRGFTAAAVLTLSTGIGATTAICSIVRTVLLAPLPLTDGDRLVRIVEHDRPRNLPGINYREYLEWQPRTTTLSGLAAAGSHPQVIMPARTGLVRVTGGFVSPNPAAVVPQVQHAVTRADANAALDAIMPLNSLVANAVARHRFYAVMLTGFAAVAALLAAIGIYGVLAYSVVERTREIGLRMALGARRQEVLGLVLRRGLSSAAVGILIGLVGAATGTRYLRAILFGVTPLDGTTFVMVAVTFAAVAAIASYVPARRATRVDPMVALRNE